MKLQHIFFSVNLKRWFRNSLMIAVLFPCYLLTACSTETPRPSIEAASEQTVQYTEAQADTVATSEMPSSSEVTQPPLPFEPEASGEVDFRYIYRGFTAVSLNDREMFEKFMGFGTQIIATEEEWDAFMASYCPGIPYYEPWDFSEDYLCASIVSGASPTYASSNTTTRLFLENGRFLPEFENNPANYVCAMNTAEYTHFFVEVMAVSKAGHADDGVEKQDTSSEEAQIIPADDIQTIFRGFSMVSLDDRDAFEDFSAFGTRRILTEEDWDAFTSAFCPGMPSDEQLDFSKDGVIASIMLGAKPTYACSSEIVGIEQETGFVVTENDLTKCIYALNSENYTHFYLEVIAMDKEKLPENVDIWTLFS